MPKDRGSTNIFSLASLYWLMLLYLNLSILGDRSDTNRLSLQQLCPTWSVHHGRRQTTVSHNCKAVIGIVLILNTHNTFLADFF